MSNSAEKQKNWYQKDPNDRLTAQVEAIQSINDEGTSADETLSYSKIFLMLLLAYSGLLGAMSYYKNFEPSFGHQAALFMCLALAVTIEAGKNFFGKWALRLPMFQGFRYLKSEVHNSFRFMAMVAFSVATFAMSINNSTKGGQQLAKMLRHEREAETFTPNTSAIDGQIASTQDAINGNLNVKWKGTQTYQAQKSTVTLSSTLSQLQEQKNKDIAMQREDFVQRQSIKSDNSNFAASVVMASGGWVELLQVLLLVLIVSSERTLLKRALEAAEQSQTAAPSITNLNGQRSQTRNATDPTSYNATRQPIGFFTTPPEPVTQCVTPVTQIENAGTGVPSLAAFKHFLTDFRRYAWNLKTSNGARKTLCEKLGAAAKGMVETVGYIDDKTAETTKLYIESFMNEIHADLMTEYTSDDLRNTPLSAYHGHVSILYDGLCKIVYKQPIG